MIRNKNIILIIFVYYINTLQILYSQSVLSDDSKMIYKRYFMNEGTVISGIDPDTTEKNGPVNEFPVKFSFGLKLGCSIQFHERLKGTFGNETEKRSFSYPDFATIFRLMYKNEYALDAFTGMMPFPDIGQSNKTIDFGGWEVGFQIRKFFKNSIFNISLGYILHKNWKNYDQGHAILHYEPGTIFSDEQWHGIVGVCFGMRIYKKISIDLSFWKIITEHYGDVFNDEYLGNYTYRKIPEKMQYIIRCDLIYMF